MKSPVSKYDAVYVYETDFQKSIIDVLLQTRPAAENRLIIDARDHRIKIEDKEYRINLNGFKRTMASFKERSRLPSVITDELVCTAFPGINCRLFPAIIRHSRLSIFDDGTGTPVIIKEGRYLMKSFNLFLRLLFAGLFTFIMYGKVLPVGEKGIFKRISRYYTIYPFARQGYMDKYLPSVDVVDLDYFDKKVLKAVSGIGFISTGNCPEKNKELQKVLSETGSRPVYYPHPHEDLSLLDRSLVSEIVRPGGPLEQHFLDNGVPSSLYGEISTVFLNLRLMDCPAPMVVFYTFDKEKIGYYELFESVGVELRELK